MHLHASMGIRAKSPLKMSNGFLCLKIKASEKPGYFEYTAKMRKILSQSILSYALTTSKRKTGYQITSIMTNGAGSTRKEG